MFLLKLLALPLVAVVTLIQWVAIFLTSFSAILFDLLAGIIFMITLAGLLFGVCTGMEALKMIGEMLLQMQSKAHIWIPLLVLLMLCWTKTAGQ